VSFSDRLRDFWDKKKEEEAQEQNASAKPRPQPPAPANPLPPARKPANREDIEQLIEKEKKENEAKAKARDKEAQELRLNLEKLDLEAKTRREAHQQNSQLLKNDAEREIKYLERKLQEDSAVWAKQLAEREKAMQEAALSTESTAREQKAASEQEAKERADSVQQIESALKEQQAKLAQDRQRWQDLLRGKDAELLTLKQELARREAALEEELQSQEAQQKAAKELWETRLRELEKQWADKRKAWEQAMKTAEEERQRLHNTFQERQATWHLELERHLQDFARREERAAEKLAALQAHFSKEAKSWKDISENREEQVKQQRVKLLLSETEAKARADQAQKVFQEKVVAIAQQVQTLQSQLNDEQIAWKRNLENKESEIKALRADIAGKLRQMETDYTQKMSGLNGRKETLTAELEALKNQQHDQQKAFDERIAQLKAEESTITTATQQRLAGIQKALDQETLRLQTEIQAVEKQKDATEQEVAILRQRSQEEIRAKEETLKTVQASLTQQEETLRARFAPDEDATQRQVEALKARNRSLERELVKVRENLERAEKDHAAAMFALETDGRNQEALLQKNSDEQEDRLKKRLDERKLSLEAFLAMKKEEESRLQAALKAKEKERAEISERLANLPKLIEQEIAKKRETAKKELDLYQKKVQGDEQQLAEFRDQAKSAILAKAAQLSSLRQSLEARQKELNANLRSKESIWASERAGIEKQLSAAQAEMDRSRAHWQAEIVKKEQEAKALDAEMRKQETLHRQALEREEKVLQEKVAPLEAQRLSLSQTLEKERLDQDQKIRDFETQTQDAQDQIQRTVQQGQQDENAQDLKFREERARLKAQAETLTSEQAAVIAASQETLQEKAIQVEQLEEQVRQHAVAHESRKRELIHGATIKSRTLQDILQQLEAELKASREAFPQELRAKEDKLTQLTQQLSAEQARGQQLMARYDRAMSTLARRGQQKQSALQSQLAKLKEESAKKLATRDAEIAAIQSDLLAKETARQGELDRLAKQFAEERFQLEKSKEELEWKLKDHKEVSERQLAGRQKEVHFLETEIARIKTLREQQLVQKAAAFEAEKQKIQAAWTALQAQVETERTQGEAALIAKEGELKNLISRSKSHLSALGEEFTQKVASWRSTTEALKAQIEQIKKHWAETQDHWETVRKEKADEIGALRQELSQWEARLQSDVQTMERAHVQERQALLGQVRRREKDLEESQAAFKRRFADKEEEVARAVEEIRGKESAAELQWRSSLEQWQSDKGMLDQEKVHLEQELVALQSRSERELREMEDTIAKMRVEVTFKESQTQSQQERLKAQHEKELIPLKDQIGQLTAKLQSEKAAWDSRLLVKENDLRIMKTRIAWRDKRLQDEVARREKELSALKKTVVDEVQKVRARYEAEKRRIEEGLKDRRAALTALQAQQGKQQQSRTETDAFINQSLQTHRAHLEESLRQLVAQSAELQKNYEAALQEKEAALAELETGLKLKDAAMQEMRFEAKKIGDRLRSQLDSIQQLQQKGMPVQNLQKVAVGAMFEQGIQQYKAKHWAQAAGLFQECLRQDPKWAAAYQYLALVYQAQGLESEASWAADQALEKDPQNAQLAAWAQQLRASLNLKEPPAA
jgi:hypothetical protein